MPHQKTASASAQYEQEILEQYDSERGAQFYKTVMSGSGFNIHYGLYENDSDTVEDATQKAMQFMVNAASPWISDFSGQTVVDLGSGCGGAAHFLAQQYASHVTCVNLCAKQNEVNQNEAERLGISDRVDVHEASFDNLPDEWTDRFKIVWSEDAFCYGMDKRKILQEAKRILAPGGILLFTDILSGEEATAEDLVSFTSKNVTTGLAKPSDYLTWGRAEGFRTCCYSDLSEYLVPNFQRMIGRIDTALNDMDKKHADYAYLESFRASLAQRIGITQAGKLAWGCFVMTPELGFS